MTAALRIGRGIWCEFRRERLQFPCPCRAIRFLGGTPTGPRTTPGPG